MLGGLPHVSRIDIQGSKNFFAKLTRRSKLLDRRRRPVKGPSEAQTNNDREKSGEQQKKEFAVKRAVDCGAGIGRITLNFLSTVAETVDIVEPVAKFTQEIAEGESFAGLREAGRVGEVHSVGLQDWCPVPGTYDLIWNQWCLCQLTDGELVEYLRRAKAALKEGGWLVVKENVATFEVDEFDASDSSVTRCLTKWRSLYKEAGCHIEMEEVQRGFPKELFAVRMWALRPA